MIGNETHALQPDLGANRNELQLGEQLFMMLEDSKWQLESILDEQSDVFAILDTQRRILRSNSALARLMGCDVELCIGKTLDSILAPESLEIFQGLASDVFHESSRNPLAARQLELPVRRQEGQGLIPFWWSVQMIRLGRRGEIPVPALLLTGRDISELRGKERQLDEMFAGIPVGILGVGREGRVLGIYSNYSRMFFGEREVIGERLGQIIAELGGADFSQADREAFTAFEALFGEPQLMVELVLETMPKEHKIRKAGLFNMEAVVGITYQPVFRDDGLEKILVLLEDRTQLAREREERANSGGDDPDAQRMAHVKRQTPEFLSIFEGDAEGFLARSLREMRSRNQEALASALHGLKGTVRVARFDLLFPQIQDLEGLIKKWNRDEDQSSWGEHWSHIQTQMSNIEKEWRLTRNLIRAVHGDGLADAAKKWDEKLSRRIARLERLTHFAELRFSPARAWIRQDRLALLRWWRNDESLGATMRFLEEQVKRNESTFSCSVTFDATVYGGRVSHRKRSDILEILLHLVNNTFAHALEPEHERLKAGKPARMRMQLEISLSLRRIKIVFSDDGRGVDPDRLRKKLVELKLKTEEQAREMSDAEARNAIFISGLSTQANRDEVAGTGVGLAAVMRRIDACRGRITLDSVTGKSTRFEITLPLQVRFSQRAELLSLPEICARLQKLGDLSIEGLDGADPARRYRLPLERALACLLALARHPLDSDEKPIFRVRASTRGGIDIAVFISPTQGGPLGWLDSLQKQERRAAAKDLKSLGLETFSNGDWKVLHLRELKLGKRKEG